MHVNQIMTKARHVTRMKTSHAGDGSINVTHMKHFVQSGTRYRALHGHLDSFWCWLGEELPRHQLTIFVFELYKERDVPEQ